MRKTVSKSAELAKSYNKMLESLFGEDTDDIGSTGSDHGTKSPRANLRVPPAPRNNTKLSGLSNLGATCYLNSLLQTLHFTAEFRGLFRQLLPHYHVKCMQ